MTESMANPMTDTALRVDDLVKTFDVSDRHGSATLTAVDRVSFDVAAGETVALIGESGSGKSTVARSIARLVEPTSGTVTLGETTITDLPKRSLWKAYDDVQMVFQDPVTSLNPRMTARATVEEPLRIHRTMPKAERIEFATALLEDVGLGAELALRYPRQLSGGQCQRVAIARALAVDPALVLLDEPTASLDVSVRRQILELLQRLQAERGLAYLFISHDLEVVRGLADRVLVMYLGTIVEEGPADQVFDHPVHPYTRALLSSATVAECGHTTTRFRLEGELGDTVAVPSGCRLAPRCPLAETSCTTTEPELLSLTPTHRARCPITVAQTKQNLLFP